MASAPTQAFLGRWVAVNVVVLLCSRRGQAACQPAAWSSWNPISTCATIDCNSNYQLSRQCVAQTGTCSNQSDLVCMASDATSSQQPGARENVFRTCAPSWSEWEAGSCNVTCGTGMRSLVRQCNPGCSAACVGGSTQKYEACDGCCPVDASWGAWSALSDCSTTCSVGARTRTRTCGAGACGGQAACNGTVAAGTISAGAQETYSEICDNGNCCPVDGTWTYSQWSAWSALCPSTGKRTRTPLNCTAQCGGKCVGGVGAVEETRTPQGKQLSTRMLCCTPSQAQDDYFH